MCTNIGVDDRPYLKYCAAFWRCLQQGLSLSLYDGSRINVRGGLAVLITDLPEGAPFVHSKGPSAYVLCRQHLVTAATIHHNRLPTFDLLYVFACMHVYIRNL